MGVPRRGRFLTLALRRSPTYANVSIAFCEKNEAMKTKTGSDNFWVLTGGFGRVSVNLIERPIVPHIHTQHNWIVKLDGADAEFRNETDRWLLDDSTVLTFNPMEMHEKADIGKKPTLALSMLIEPIWLREIFSKTGLPPPHRFPRSRETITEEIRHLVASLSIAISQPSRCESGSALQMLHELATAMVKSYHESAVIDYFDDTRPTDFRIRNALGFIRHNLGNRPTIEKVAKEVGLSRSRFFEQFKGCLGISPQHYIDSSRVSCATTLLTRSAASLAEISDELGFSQPAHFTRFFTQHTGVAPSTFRRNASLLDE